MSSISLRPRRRAAAAAASSGDGPSNYSARTEEDAEEVRQSAAVLEMLASKSQSRANGEEEDNVTLSDIIASVIEQQQRQQEAHHGGWTVGQILKATRQTILENFTEYKNYDGKHTFKCRLLPNECAVENSHASKSRAEKLIQDHLVQHANSVKRDIQTGKRSETMETMIFYPVSMQPVAETPSPSRKRSYGLAPLATSTAAYAAKKNGKRKTMYDEDPEYSPSGSSKKKTLRPRPPPAPKSQSTPRRKQQHQSDSPLRRSARRSRSRISVEVTVTTDEEEEDEAERAANFFGRQPSFTSDDHDHSASAPVAQVSAPKFYEMTPQLLESLMAPVGLFQSPSEDGMDKELRLRMPVDFGGGCVGVCDTLFNEHLGVKIDGATDWMPVHFVGDYLDAESVEISDSAAGHIDESLGFSPPRSNYSGASLRSSLRSATAPANDRQPSSLTCKEEFNRIATVVDMDFWMDKINNESSASKWLFEHDYSEPNLKFGRPRSANILQDAIAAFNKYVNFIRLSERREPFLFGLWWEREDIQADYWMLPKLKEGDDECDRRQALLVVPIANEWTEEVVVSSEETVEQSGSTGHVTPMTFWDNRGFLSPNQLDANESMEDYSLADTGVDTSIDESPFKRPNDPDAKPTKRRRTTATPVTRAPRFLAPKLDPGSAVMVDERITETGIDELVNTIQSLNERAPGMLGGYARTPASMANFATATGSQLKNVTREKLDEMDFAMRCIKELQQRRYTGIQKLHCRICTREFTAPTSLIVHYRSHAGIKPFTCPICLTSFTRRHSLKYHMLCHSGQARFRCNLCDRLFRHSGHYKDHLRKHEHGLPFNCQQCNRVFATRTTYRRHMAMVHNAMSLQKGKGRSVGVSKWTLDAEIEGLDDLEAGELGEVAEEIEYEGDEYDEEDLDNLVAEELAEGEVL